MKYVVPALLVLGLISAACGDTQREAAPPTQAPTPETALSPTPEPPSAEELLVDSQAAHIADLRENIESLESSVEDLESKNQEAAQLIDDLEAESEKMGQLVEDLQSETSVMEEMLNDLRCRSHIDIELVLDGCDWEPPDSMPRQIGAWTWSEWNDEDTLIITYAVEGAGADTRSLPDFSMYCVWGVNSEVFINMTVEGDLHEAGEAIVDVDYRIGGTERLEIPWISWAGSGYTNLSPDWEYNEMMLDDLRTGAGTLEVSINSEDRPPLQAEFEIDGAAEVLDMLEPGCGGKNSALGADAA